MSNVTQRLQVYKCAICGNIVEVLNAGGGELVCCGQPMTLLIENTVDASKEKHVPVIEKTADGVRSKSAPSPIPWRTSTTSSGSSDRRRNRLPPIPEARPGARRPVSASRPRSRSRPGNTATSTVCKGRTAA